MQRERGGMTCRSDSNPQLPQCGPSLCTWGGCSTELNAALTQWCLNYIRFLPGSILDLFFAKNYDSNNIFTVFLWLHTFIALYRFSSCGVLYLNRLTSAPLHRSLKVYSRRNTNLFWVCLHQGSRLLKFLTLRVVLCKVLMPESVIFCLTSKTKL